MFDGSDLPFDDHIADGGRGGPRPGGGGGGLDLARIRAIEALTDIPLVLRGGPGVPRTQRANLAAQSNICKFNIGTERRIAFGAALRRAVDKDPGPFDRVATLQETHEPVHEAARSVFRDLGASGRSRS